MSNYESVIASVLKSLNVSNWTDLNDVYRQTRLTRLELIFILYILEREGLIEYKKSQEKIKLQNKGSKYLELPSKIKKILGGEENLEQGQKR